jgi:O-antigen/teichoic acid export membrane protein
MSVTKTVARNTIIQVIGRLLYLLTSLWIVKILSGVFEQSGFGQYNFMVDYLGFFGVAIDLGLYLIVLQRISQFEEGIEREKAVGEVISIRFALGVVSFAIAIVGSILMPISSEMHQAIVIGAFGFFAFSAGQVFSGVSQGYYRAEFGSIAELAGKVVTLFGVLAISVFDLPFLYTAVSILAGNGTTFLLAWLFARRFLRIRLGLSWSTVKKTLRDALPLGLIISFSNLYSQLDQKDSQAYLLQYFLTHLCFLFHLEYQ